MGRSVGVGDHPAQHFTVEQKADFLLGTRFATVHPMWVVNWKQRLPLESDIALMLALAPLETGLSPRRQQIHSGQLSRNGELVGTEKRQFIYLCLVYSASIFFFFGFQILSNSIKQKRKEKAGKWAVPVPKVRPIADDEMFRVIRTGKRKSMILSLTRCLDR